MSRYAPSEDAHEHQPITWLAGYAVYAAHLIIVVYVASLLATALLMVFHAEQLLSWLTFYSAAVLRGEVWRVVTYGLRNEPSIGFVIDMFIIGWFGREVERFFGRTKFLTL